jgi:transcriptional regulator GlxA family with amidase domain
LNGGTVKSAGGVLRVETSSISADFRCSHLIIVGSERAEKTIVRRLAPFIWQCHERGCHIYAVSTAAFLLAEIGLLEDLRAAVHWNQIEPFKAQFPSIALSLSTVQKAGRIYTCTGGLGSIDLMIQWISEVYEPNVGSVVSDRFVCGYRHHCIPTQSGIIHRHIRCRIPELSLVIDHIDANQGAMSKGDLVRISGLGHRQLERLCKRHLGISPLRLVRQIQLRRARDLLNASTLTVSDVALTLGFSSVAYFSTIYKRWFGQRPTEQRCLGPYWRSNG